MILFWMASFYRLQIEDFLRSRQYEADRVLDVGGGSGRANKITTVKANRYLVLDNDKDTKPDITQDLNEFAHPSELFAGERSPYFDLIFCLNVFEYIYNPYVAIANLYSWLNVGGKLVINFPFIYPLHNPVGLDCLRYTSEWVDRIFAKYQFKVIEKQPILATSGKDDLLNFYSKEKMHLRKDGSWQEIGTIIEAIK